MSSPGGLRTAAESVCIVEPHKEREDEHEQVFKEIMPENVPNLLTDRTWKIQGAEQIPNKINPKKFTTGCNIIKLLKAKSKGEKISKTDREMGHYF